MKKAKLRLYLSTTLWTMEAKFHTFIISMLNYYVVSFRLYPKEESTIPIG
jgi:hypothetical protein